MLNIAVGLSIITMVLILGMATTILVQLAPWWVWPALVFLLGMSYVVGDVVNRWNER